ncbi:hypothetical protein [Rhizobium hidalgonense]|nr:hypothetical protein [Rhizobium hidalgonense]
MKILIWPKQFVVSQIAPAEQVKGDTFAAANLPEIGWCDAAYQLR